MQQSAELRPSQRNKIGHMKRDEGIVRSIEKGSPVTRPARRGRKVRLPWCRGCQCRWCVGSCRARAWTWIWRAGRAPGAGCADPPAQARAPSSPAVASFPLPSLSFLLISYWAVPPPPRDPRLPPQVSSLYRVELHTMIRVKTVKHLTPPLLREQDRSLFLAPCFRCASATEGEERGKHVGAVGPLVRLTKLVCSLRGTEWARIGLMTRPDGVSVPGFSPQYTRVGPFAVPSVSQDRWASVLN